jgi:hypothetical protein
MKRPAKALARPRSARRAIRQGYTLVEMLTATLLTLMMMMAVVTLFESVGKAITDSRHVLEMNDRLRAAAGRLQKDLEGLTVSVQPPRRPEGNEGYFEYTEGPIGPVIRPEALFVNGDLTAPNNQDTTVTDNDDILAFTTHSDVPFVGRYRQAIRDPNTGQIMGFANATIESNDAEIIWFVRGRTLYRRVLLVAPELLTQCDANRDGLLDRRDNGLLTAPDGTFRAFHAYFDISARPETYDATNMTGWVPNTLGDLTKRENRFAHRILAEKLPLGLTPDGFPFDARRWGQLGMPTAYESSALEWMTWPDFATFAAWTQVTYQPQIDLWNRPYPWTDVLSGTTPKVNPNTGMLNQFNGVVIAEDVILTEVIGFDVKAWDPGAPIVGQFG